MGRTAWNNVIIFAMLLMIFLFNGLHHKILSVSDESSQSVLPINSAILTMQYGNLKIERIGTGWRANRSIVTDLNILAVSWNQAQGEVVTESSEATKDLAEVELVLAGYEQPLIFVLQQSAKGYLLADNQARILQIDEQTRTQLFPFLEDNQ